ncbi:forkhead box protein M1 isoform X2 [Kryptolebias marmoratus]|uniref:Forkhead box protein M1 n=2 Tax=Kryptolebias marmoratus TaxID=37003 RepID=A0A3Q3FT01_KRYMA|nr:forkhead box protein M1 isoform X2 [Kryptolebias marmoratus]
MRRSPRRPLILKRRKLPFPPNEPAPASSGGSKEPSKPAASQGFPDGVRIMDHPSISGTQVVVVPKEADLQSVIGALTAKGKECGVHGPNKFILLSGSQDNGSFSQASVKEESVPPSSTAGQPADAESKLSSPDAKPVSGNKSMNKDASCRPLDDSLTNIQWLGRMSSCALEQDTVKQDQENQIKTSQNKQESAKYTNAEVARHPMAERPPYSYMAMIQFAINSSKSRRMTLKEIYTWIEDHFPYYRQVAKPGWKNSIRHNLSLHDMFLRETSPDSKISFWTIRPEVNRCLTYDQVYKRMTPIASKMPTGSERKMKPLLPRTESYLVPIQLPVAPSVYLPSSSASIGPKRKQSSFRTAKRVRIAPKVAQSDLPAVVRSHLRNNSLNVEMKQEPIDVSVKSETPKAPPKKQASRSRRKQRLNSLHEEPILLCPDNTFFDSGIAFDASTFQDARDAELNQPHQGQDSPDREFSFKTPIKSSGLLTSSTPSKPTPSVVTEPWKVTPVGKRSQNVLDFSPIRTPGGPTVTPQNDYTTFSFSSTPFKDLPLFSSPRELLANAPPRAPRAREPSIEHMRSGCSRGLLQAGGASPPPNRSVTEGLVLDTMNDSLSKILVDISFTGLDGEDLGTANISWSEFIGQF